MYAYVWFPPHSGSCMLTSRFDLDTADRFLTLPLLGEVTMTWGDEGNEFNLRSLPVACIMSMT